MIVIYITPNHGQTDKIATRSRAIDVFPLIDSGTAALGTLGSVRLPVYLYRIRFGLKGPTKNMYWIFDGLALGCSLDMHGLALGFRYYNLRVSRESSNVQAADGLKHYLKGSRWARAISALTASETSVKQAGPRATLRVDLRTNSIAIC
ncbi:hypothetical protein AG1IA_06055 [Rhizoctonia solani AG-1 IA]|uniref:Uncharacterized protein n=1 Tax=Thanatephorus cucumeris (strain AG1-IA) TaxID=983506 RepID=L8WPL0_THACA|nr:hypothetical protein AG1IA_06055 [Rhizoctonia solani AG-1 IA]